VRPRDLFDHGLTLIAVRHVEGHRQDAFAGHALILKAVQRIRASRQHQDTRRTFQQELG